MPSFASRFRISPRPSAIFAILALALLLLNAHTLWGMGGVVNALQGIREQRIPEIDRLVKIGASVDRIAVDAGKLLIYREPTRQGAVLLNMRKETFEALRLFALVKPGVRSPDGLRLVANTERLATVTEGAIKEYVARATSSDFGTAAGYLDEHVYTSLQTVNTLLGELRAHEFNAIGQAADVASERLAFTRSLTIVAVCVLLLLGTRLA